MRNYEHVVVNGQILSLDHKSAKAAYGLHSKEYMDQHDPDFLREGQSTIPPFEIVYQLTKPSEPCAKEYTGHPVGGDQIVVEGIDASGQGYEHGIHKDKVKWK